MNDPHAILVSSQKGGVGKTTIAVNLATSLRMMGYNVLLVDDDLSNPSVGFHLGLHDANIGIRALVSGKTTLVKATIIHNPTGLHVLSGEVTGNMAKQGIYPVVKLYDLLRKSGYDYIVIDMPPGTMPLGVPSKPHKANLEALIVITPELSSCASAFRLSQYYSRQRIGCRFVLNRRRNKKYELGTSEIEDALSQKVSAEFPEDENVPISTSQHSPLYLINRQSPFSREMRYFVRSTYGRDNSEFEPDAKTERPRKGFFAWLFGLFRRNGA